MYAQQNIERFPWLGQNLEGLLGLDRQRVGRNEQWTHAVDSRRSRAHAGHRRIQGKGIPVNHRLLADKLGPMTRSVEDALLVLNAISGPDPGDLQSVPSKLDYDADAGVKGLRVGYFPKWMKEAPATGVDRAALETVKKLGMVPVEVSIPEWPYQSLNLILFAEGAAAFEELTLSGEADQLKVQTYDAWPNLFRQSRFLSAVDFVQTDRLRRRVAEEMARVFSEVDLLLVPSLRDEMLTITNFTGQPSLTMRAGFVEVSEARTDWAPDPSRPIPKFSPARRVPHGITLIGRLFEEGTLGRAGLALERAFNVVAEHPPGF